MSTRRVSKEEFEALFPEYGDISGYAALSVSGQGETISYMSEKSRVQLKKWCDMLLAEKAEESAEAADDDVRG